MPKEKIGDLLEERAKLVNEQREALDAAETEKRSLTAEDRQAYDERGARIGELEGDIRRYEDLQNPRRHSALGRAEVRRSKRVQRSRRPPSAVGTPTSTGMPSTPTLVVGSSARSSAPSST